MNNLKKVIALLLALMLFAGTVSAMAEVVSMTLSLIHI